MRSGTIVDATIIAPPSSPKNQEHSRDPEMHQKGLLRRSQDLRSSAS